MIVLTAAAIVAVAAPLPGTYTNEEQVYFATEAGKPTPPWTGVKITREGGDYRVQPVDSYGAPKGASLMMRVSEGRIDGHEVISITTGSCVIDFAQVPAGLTIVNQRGDCTGQAALTTVTQAGLAMRMADGAVLDLQRARAFKCWASIPRKALKDGKPDWWFKSGLMLHDRGGRVLAETDEAVPQRFTFRMRNVVWPTGSNEPSLVLYVHGDDPDHAISYSWADPGAKRIGINLRTVQGSCTLVPRADSAGGTPGG
jgi:hypothetical protein